LAKNPLKDLSVASAAVAAKTYENDRPSWLFKISQTFEDLNSRCKFSSATEVVVGRGAPMKPNSTLENLENVFVVCMLIEKILTSFYSNESLLNSARTPRNLSITVYG